MIVVVFGMRVAFSRTLTINKSHLPMQVIVSTNNPKIALVKQ